MKLAGLVENIYEAAFVPQKWSEVLDALCLVTGSASSTMLLADGVNPPRWKTTERTREILESLSRTDVWKQPDRSPERLIEASIGGRYFHCVNDLMTTQQLERDEVYRQFKQAGLGWQVGTAILTPATDTIILSFERNFADGRHSDAQLACMGALRPHLARAGLIGSRLGLEYARGALDAMGGLGIPAALLDRAGRLREVNAWMTPDLIGERGGGRAALGEADGDALLGSILRGESTVRSIPLPPNAQAPGRVAHVIPIAGAALDIFSGSPSLIVMNLSTGTFRRPDLTILRALFDLSPAESRLAVELAGGATLAQAAVLCRIRTSTARAYLEQIFRKTGCHRQAELLNLLTGLTRAAPGANGYRHLPVSAPR